MGRKTQIGIIAAVALLLFGVVGVWAYDHSKRDQISDGVKVGNIDIGGLSADQARARLQRRLVDPLQHSIQVTFAGQRYTLPAKDLHVRANVDAIVGQAVDASRSAFLPVRDFRYLTGGSLDKQINPEIQYSTKAVNDFVKQVSDKVNRDPVDATVSPSSDSLNVVAGKNGRAVNQSRLLSKVQEVASGEKHAHLITVTVHTTKPKVTTSQVAAANPVYLTLNRAAFTLTLWKHLKKTKSYTVAVGQQGLETPAGLYHIQDKQVNPSWQVPNSAWAGSLAGQTIPPGPEDPIKARWMGIFAGAGIHGTDETWSLGSAVSHGCVRMSIPDVIELYPQVPVGTPIYIG
jgi:lipoprotein-anchoring transpeptidase ErfK/SrfK